MPGKVGSPEKAQPQRKQPSGDRAQPSRQGVKKAATNNVDADVFISIHINSARNRRLRGFETYYLDMAIDPSAAETAARENASGEAGSMGDLGEMLEAIMKNDFQAASSELAASIQDSLVMHVAKSYGNVHDLGVKTAPFYRPGVV